MHSHIVYLRHRLCSSHAHQACPKPKLPCPPSHTITPPDRASIILGRLSLCSSTSTSTTEGLCKYWSRIFHSFKELAHIPGHELVSPRRQLFDRRATGRTSTIHLYHKSRCRACSRTTPALAMERAGAFVLTCSISPLFSLADLQTIDSNSAFLRWRAYYRSRRRGFSQSTSRCPPSRNFDEWLLLISLP